MHKIGTVVKLLTNKCTLSLLNDVSTTSNFFLPNKISPIKIYTILKNAIFKRELLIL